MIIPYNLLSKDLTVKQSAQPFLQYSSYIIGLDVHKFPFKNLELTSKGSISGLPFKVESVKLEDHIP